ncbi:MAG: hypothetical protein KAJ55_00175 [Anaerolineales bacterium]|nr:hypothetical protein [Anaerolineales bacterium]
MKRPEQKIRIEIREFLKTISFAVWDLEQNRKTRQTPGFSDLVAFGHGLILFIEVKTEKGTQSDFQKGFEVEVKANGGHYLLWRDVREVWDYLVGLGIITETDHA